MQKRVSPFFFAGGVAQPTCNKTTFFGGSATEFPRKTPRQQPGGHRAVAPNQGEGAAGGRQLGRLRDPGQDPAVLDTTYTPVLKNPGEGRPTR